MPRVPAFLVALGVALGLGAGHIHAAEAAAPEPHGAIVVAVGPGAEAGAEALARAAYREPTLRPNVDEATARVLIGAAPPTGASAKLTELATLRASLHAPSSATSDAVQRRLLASIGAELRAVLVIAVEAGDAAPRAKILRAEDASLLGTELVSTRRTSPDSPDSIAWPGSPAVLRALLPTSVTLTPLAPKAPPAKAATPAAASKEVRTTSRTSWSSPWLWGGLGVLAAAGVTVFVLSQVEADSDPAQMRVQGRVAP
jgi:hypothetical protein